MRSNPDPRYSFMYLADDDLHQRVAHPGSEQAVARLGARRDGASGICFPGDPEPAPPRHPLLGATGPPVSDGGPDASGDQLDLATHARDGGVPRGSVRVAVAYGRPVRPVGRVHRDPLGELPGWDDREFLQPDRHGGLGSSGRVGKWPVHLAVGAEARHTVMIPSFPDAVRSTVSTISRARA